MNVKTSFALVAAMNTAFNNPKGDPHNVDWARLKSQVENIRRELKETLDAIEARDLEQTRDGLCDIQVFAMGGQHFIGVDGDADMAAVVEGVMTRFCRNQEELDATMAKYDALGVTYYGEGAFPTYCLKSARDQTDQGDEGGNGDEYPKGKFLKSVGYKTAVFPPLPEQ